MEQFSGCVQAAANHNAEICAVGFLARANASILLQRINSCTSFQFDQSEVYNSVCFTDRDFCILCHHSKLMFLNLDHEDNRRYR